MDDATSNSGLCAHCERPFDPHGHRGKLRRYCSQKCNQAAYRIRRAAARATFDPCEAADCQTLRRSRNARWCEMHYARWYRDTPVEGGRLQGGTCRHCGEPTGSKRRVYCSQLCFTRIRIGAPYEPDRRCLICDKPLPHQDRYTRGQCCPGECADTARRIASYGISVGDYRAMLISQAGACAICSRPDGRLVIDHRHDVDASVRGLLCGRCNLGIGQFADDPDLLDAAALYLRTH